MTLNSPPKPRILYAFQGTGNGHAARALELIPILKRYAHLEVLCSGNNSQLDLPFKLDYHLKGISFSYNKRGGLSYGQTFRKANFFRFRREVRNLDLSPYDLVLNDFEPVSAYAAKKQGSPIIAISHQAAFLSSKSPRPKRKHYLAEWIFKNYAPAPKAEAFHFSNYDRFIHFPVLRKEIKALKTSNLGKYLVYLPAYSEAHIKEHLLKLSNKDWIIFSKECKQVYRQLNLEFRPINGSDFLSELAKCEGLLCSAGFEAPAEALYLGKKLFVIPIKGQYEQNCNAAALKRLGIPSATDLNFRTVQLLQDWAYGEKLDTKLEIEDAERLIINILDRQKLLIKAPQKLDYTN